MTTKHSPTIRLAAARLALSIARQDCPHWDMESDGDGHDECCHRLDEAKLELRRAVNMVERTP